MPRHALPRQTMLYGWITPPVCPICRCSPPMPTKTRFYITDLDLYNDGDVPFGFTLRKTAMISKLKIFYLWRIFRTILQ